MISRLKILKGAYQNKIIWVCALHYIDLFAKPARHIKPSKAIYTMLDGDRYSGFYLLGKKDQPLKSQKINVDSSTSWTVRFFETEQECKFDYLKRCNTTLEAMEAKIIFLNKESDRRKLEVVQFKNER